MNGFIFAGALVGVIVLIAGSCVTHHLRKDYLRNKEARTARSNEGAADQNV